MPLAKEVAAELRKLADALDKYPDTVIPTADVYLRAESKDVFTDSVRILPRPLKKELTDTGQSWARIRVKHGNTAMRIDCSVPQSLCCILVEPAKPAVYKCPPILSPDEDANLIA